MQPTEIPSGSDRRLVVQDQGPGVRVPFMPGKIPPVVSTLSEQGGFSAGQRHVSSLTCRLVRMARASIVGMYRETGEPVYSVLYQREGGGALC